MAEEGQALPPEWENAVEAFLEAVNVEFSEEGAIGEFEAYFGAFGEALRQMAEGVKVRSDAIASDTPLVGKLTDHMGEVGDALVAMGDAGDELYQTWSEEFSYDRDREFDPRAGERMLNVSADAG